MNKKMKWKIIFVKDRIEYACLVFPFTKFIHAWQTARDWKRFNPKDSYSIRFSLSI